MRKIKLKPIKRLRIPKDTQIIPVSEAEYSMICGQAYEREQRRQFWQDVYEGLRCITNAQD